VIRLVQTKPRVADYYSSDGLFINKDSTVHTVGMFALGPVLQIWDVLTGKTLCRLEWEPQLTYYKEKFILQGKWMIVAFTEDECATISQVYVYDTTPDPNSTAPIEKSPMRKITGFNASVASWDHFIYGIRKGSYYT